MDFCSHASHNYLTVVNCYTDWPAILITPPPQNSSQLLNSHFVALQFLMWFGLMEDPSSYPTNSRNFHNSGAFYTKYLAHIIPKVMGKYRPPSSVSSWNGWFLDDDKFCRGLLQYRNTPSRKDGLSPAQNYTNILSKIHYQHTPFTRIATEVQRG